MLKPRVIDHKPKWQILILAISPIQQYSVHVDLHVTVGLTLATTNITVHVHV